MSKNMMEIFPPREYTTGEVAKICGVAPATAAKWVDNKLLPGRRLPASKDRRILHDDLLTFMRKHSMPLSALEGSVIRILIDSPAQDVRVICKTLLDSGRYLTEVTDSPFALGEAVGRFQPYVVVLSADSPYSRKLAHHLRTAIKHIRVLGHHPAPHLCHDTDLYDGLLPFNFTTTDLLEAVDRVLSVSFERQSVV